jgi:hypothetical protein
LAIIGIAALKAGKAIESVKIPEAKASSHMIPRVNSSARMPSTKAFSTADRSDLAFRLIHGRNEKLTTSKARCQVCVLEWFVDSFDCVDRFECRMSVRQVGHYNRPCYGALVVVVISGVVKFDLAGAVARKHLVRCNKPTSGRWSIL